MKLNVLVSQLIPAGMLLIAGACTLRDRSSCEPSRLPTASANLHWATMNVPRGSCCRNSGGQGACADSASVDVLLQSGYLKPYRTAGGYRVQIAFHSTSAPINSKIELVKAPSGRLGAVKEAAPLAFDLPVIPTDGAGVYVYLEGGLGQLLPAVECENASGLWEGLGLITPGARVRHTVAPYPT